MKFSKPGWIATMTVGGLLAAGTIAQAQEKKEDKPASPPPAAPAAPPAPAAPGVRVAPGGGLGLANRPDIRAARIESRLRGLAQTLNLTDDQKTKIKPILEEEATQMEQAQQDKSIPVPERIKKLREIREASQAKIRPILTSEQQQTFEKQRPGSAQRRPAIPSPTAPGAPAAPPAK